MFRVYLRQAKRLRRVPGLPTWAAPPPLKPNAFRRNPFGSPGWYVNPSLSKNLDETIKRSSAKSNVISTLRAMQKVFLPRLIDLRPCGDPNGPAKSGEGSSA